LSAYRRLVIWISVRPRTFWAGFREAGAAGCLLNPPACASIVATAGQSVQSLFSLTASPDSRRGIESRYRCFHQKSIVTGKIVLVIGNNIKYNLRALISAAGPGPEEDWRVLGPAARKSGS